MSSASALAPLQLLVGLGNPGDKYDGTRHNVGFMALERLAARAQGTFRNQSKLHGLLAEVGQGPQRLRLLMPQTYMNDSGRAIRAALDWFNLEASQMLVLVDDMDLPLGRLRLRLSGGAGGHNGLSNAEDPLQPQDPYPRVKALRDTMHIVASHDGKTERTVESAEDYASTLKGIQIGRAHV